ncbi:unnamed protein product [Blepharisma stoltei]|uniref:Ubiquitin-like domain-containing protein n=1 Tax=Blepharisma stoltei TaxID=1481888 RepID=A0AAU9IEW9_9CILI|nr:unnamed protein product [Blepharisma stoltei]
MRINIETQRDIGIEPLSVDPNYNETIENVICLISLKITTLQVNEMELVYNGRVLPLNATLDQQNIREGHTLLLRKRKSNCCSLL